MWCGLTPPLFDETVADNGADALVVVDGTTTVAVVCDERTIGTGRVAAAVRRVVNRTEAAAAASRWARARRTES